MSSQLVFVLLVGVASAVLLRLYAWRALLFLNPSRVTVESDAPADQLRLPVSLTEVARELAALGFEPLGSHSERASLAPEFLAYDYASATERAFATIYESRFGAPRLYFMTPTSGGGFVITANHRRLSRRINGHYLVGGLPGVPVDRLLKTHQKRLEGFQTEPGFTFEARLEAARTWLKGPGRWEIRVQNLNGLVFTLFSGVLFPFAILAAIAMLARQ